MNGVNDQIALLIEDAFDATVAAEELIYPAGSRALKDAIISAHSHLLNARNIRAAELRAEKKRFAA